MTQTYLARNPCGCFAGAMVIDISPSPSYLREMAKFIASMNKAKCSIETMDVEAVRAMSWAPCADPTGCVRAPKVKGPKAPILPREQAALI